MRRSSSIMERRCKMEPLRLKQQTPPPSRRTTTRHVPSADCDADEGLTLVKSSTSAVRWRDTQGHRVIQRGNRRLVVHDEPPPRHRRRPHWLLISGLTIMVVVLFLWFISGLVSWWQTTQLNAT